MMIFHVFSFTLFYNHPILCYVYVWICKQQNRFWWKRILKSFFAFFKILLNLTLPSDHIFFQIIQSKRLKSTYKIFCYIIKRTLLYSVFFGIYSVFKICLNTSRIIIINQIFITYTTNFLIRLRSSIFRAYSRQCFQGTLSNIYIIFFIWNPYI